MPRIIEIIVSPKGESTVTTKGFAGTDCLQASKALEQALGMPTSEHKTAEFFQAQTVPQQVQQAGHTYLMR